ncbi:MAG: hypothetical protein COC05_01295 [Gammaproteobacteria bacterium]|nr:flagellar hook-length control protein FliK [bacterium AH-315-E07]PCH61320.1 MAG: hypothetical protein COC05_01295 [Gammaproteobacteria bacterium]
MGNSMSVQASLNVAGVVANTKAGNSHASPSGSPETGSENQLFSGILGSVSHGGSGQLVASTNNFAEDPGEFVGPPQPDTGLSTFLSEASLGELEGKLLPLLPGVISGLSLSNQTGSLGGQLEATASVQSLAGSVLSGSNTVLEQLRGLFTGVSSGDDLEQVTDSRVRLTSLLDKSALSDQAQTNLRQEANVTSNDLRGSLNDFFDRVEKARSGDFFDLNQSFFDTAQKKMAGLDELLTGLTKTNTAGADNSANLNASTVLGHINNLISGNTAIGQPLLGVVADTGSLQASNPTQTQVAAPLNSSQWSEELGQRVRWLIGQNINAAQVRLNPAELGPVDVRINVTGDQVSVAFTSQFGVVREAIEAALPKLREMLENQGLNLADADINHGDNAERKGEDRAGTASNGELTRNGISEDAALQVNDVGNPVVEFSSSGFVDQFV